MRWIKSRLFRFRKFNRRLQHSVVVRRQSLTHLWFVFLCMCVCVFYCLCSVYFPGRLPSCNDDQSLTNAQQCVENLESILRSDKAVVYWLRSGCMHLDREGPEIVKPCPAHAICAWVPNLFADVGKLCINVFVLPVLSVCCHCCVFIVVFSSSLIRTPPFVSRALHSLHASL